MKHELAVQTTARNQMLDLTSDLSGLVAQFGLEDGYLIVHVPHTTAAVTINENADPDVESDILAKLTRLIPKQDDYQHLEGNSDAHLKSSLIGSSVTVLIEGGKLALGTWQGVFFCEFDGPRKRRVWVSLFPTKA